MVIVLWNCKQVICYVKKNNFFFKCRILNEFKMNIVNMWILMIMKKNLSEGKLNYGVLFDIF